MQNQVRLFAQAYYGEGDYSGDAYSTSTSATTQPSDGGILPNTGQDILFAVGLGLILVAVSLFVLLRRKKKNKSLNLEARSL